MEKLKEELKAKIDEIKNPVHLQLMHDLAHVKNFDANYEFLGPADALLKMSRREQIEKLDFTNGKHP